MERKAMDTQAEAGQAMVETIIVLLTICFLLFGVLQLGHAFVNRTILNHAAARAARARTVGLNRFMCGKVMLVAAIPNAGRMTTPGNADYDRAALHAARAEARSDGDFWDWALTASPASRQGDIERARIPDFLASENSVRAAYILDYDRWDAIHGEGLGGDPGDGGANDRLEVEVHQRYPLDILFRALYDWVGLTYMADREHIDLQGRYEIENHYKTYLDDRGY